jgi:hypothetical protein
MTLIENWSGVAKGAWSMWLLYTATLLGAAELALPAFQGLLPEKTFAILSLVCTFAAALARLMSQPALHEPKAA